MGIFQLIFNRHMKSDENKKWKDLEIKLQNVSDREDKVKLAINTIEEVLKQRNKTLGQKYIKGLNSMYVNLSKANNLRDKIKILAEAKEVGWTSGWNSNLRKIFSNLVSKSESAAKKNCETTLEKVNKIRTFLRNNAEIKMQDEDQSRWIGRLEKNFDGFYQHLEDEKVEGELSSEEKQKLEEYKSLVDYRKCLSSLGKLDGKLGKDSCGELNVSLKKIKKQFGGVISKDKDITERVNEIQERINKQYKIENVANEFIEQCKKYQTELYYSEDQEKVLSDKYNEISKSENWDNQIPLCEKVECEFKKTVENIKKNRERCLINIKNANEAVDIVHKKIENPKVKYENPTCYSPWTVADSLAEGVHACEKMKQDSSRYSNALKLNEALDFLYELEETVDKKSLLNYKNIEENLKYLKHVDECKESKMFLKRIENIENRVNYLRSINEVEEKIKAIPEQEDNKFPDIDKCKDYSENVKKLQNDINNIKNKISDDLKHKFTKYKSVVESVVIFKNKFQKIQDAKDNDLKTVCNKLKDINDLLAEVDRQQILGNVRTKIVAAKDDLVRKSQENVEKLKKDLKTKFESLTEKSKNYKVVILEIRHEIKYYQPLIEDKFLEKEIDQFCKDMNKREETTNYFNNFKESISKIKIKNISDKDAKVIYDMADKLIDPHMGKFWSNLFGDKFWIKYTELYNACLRKDLQTLKEESNIDENKAKFIQISRRINNARILNFQINLDTEDWKIYNSLQVSLAKNLEKKILELEKENGQKRETDYFSVAKELRPIYNSVMNFKIDDKIFIKFSSIRDEIIIKKLKNKFDDIIKQVEYSNPNLKNTLIQNMSKYLMDCSIWTKEELERAQKKMDDDVKVILESNQYFERANKEYWSVTNNEQAKKIYFEMVQKLKDVWNRGLKIDDKIFETIKHGQDVMMLSRLRYKANEFLKKYKNDPIATSMIYNNIILSNIFTESEFEWARNQMDKNIANIEKIYNDRRDKYIIELENGVKQLQSKNDKNIINDCIDDLKSASLADVQNKYEQCLNKLEELKNAQLPENLAELKDELKKIKDEVREVHKFAKGKEQDEFKNGLVGKLKTGIKLCIAKDEKIDEEFKNIMLQWSKGLSIDEHHESLFWNVRKNRKKLTSVTYNYLMFVSSILNCALDYLKYANEKKTHDLSGSVVSQIKSLFKDLEDKAQGKNITGADNPDKIEKVWDRLKNDYKIDMNNIDKYLVSESEGGKPLKDKLLLIDALCLCSSILYDNTNSVQRGTKEYEDKLASILSVNEDDIDAKVAYVTFLRDYLSKTRTEGWFGRRGMSLGWTVALMVKELLDDESRKFINKDIARAGYGSNSDEEINNKKMWEIDKNGNPILSTHDIKQTHEGTCWFTAALLGLIEKNPKKILDCFPERKNEVDQNGNIKGGVKEITVRLYRVLAELKAKDRGGKFEDTSRNHARPICPVLIKIPVIYMGFGSESKVRWANYLEIAMSVYRTDRCVEVVLKDSLDKAAKELVYDVFVCRNAIDHDVWGKGNSDYKGIWNATAGANTAIATDGIAYAAITGETAGSIAGSANDGLRSNDILKELKRKFNSEINRVAHVSFKQHFDASFLNGDKKSQIIPGYAYAVSEITDDYIVLLDPYDRKYRVTIDDFKKNVKDLKFGRTG